MSEEKSQIAEAPKNEVVKAATRRGHEQPVDQGDIMIPRVKLLQALSPEVQEGDGKLRQGMLVNSLTKEELPKDAEGWITFIPIMRSVNWVKFNARNDKDPAYDPTYELGQLIWRSNDPSDPLVIQEGKFGPKGEPPVATKFINYLAWVPGCEMPIVLSFSKTSFKAGKALTTLTEMVHGKDDLFQWKYRVRAKKEQNKAKQQYFVLEATEAGKASEEEYKRAEDVYESFKGRELKVDEEHDEEVAGEATAKQPWD